MFRLGMFGQDTTAPTDGSTLATDFSTIAAQLPALVTGYEQARLYNAATTAEITQVNALGNINPLWWIAGLVIVLVAFARR